MKEIYLVYAEGIRARAAISSNIVKVDAIIFVAETSQERARIQAHSALMNYGYRLTKVLDIFVPDPSAVSNLDPESIAQYLEAIDQGYGVVIIAHEHDSDNPLEAHSLATSIINETKNH
ncbi:hypothetical protein [Nitrosomonas sp. Nm34]|uniref:hypothetical protein n=1 Tax=Nitrosomonas sp. Nm34 TaxID=1881055 RepID=UPI0008E69B57|nr:hypothetical protein [Nitrosomonas sp. Nm34]SFI76118.1 hypothetical protein SAMN05428978_103315 [Nitrosomonas sp. Nm34]